ncbi:MAG TPA: hypothetical protein VJK72_02545 [Candidatus Nanoarchaeia archaeon]|nr:hypothetical protein [Candidatus Nanoarchaeia archaeon]
MKEIEDPELAQKRMKELFKAKGYSDERIEKRVRGIAIRDELTDEWKREEYLGKRFCKSDRRDLKSNIRYDITRIQRF